MLTVKNMSEVIESTYIDISCFLSRLFVAQNCPKFLIEMDKSTFFLLTRLAYSKAECFL